MLLDVYIGKLGLSIEKYRKLTVDVKEAHILHKYSFEQFTERDIVHVRFNKTHGKYTCFLFLLDPFIL